MAAINFKLGDVVSLDDVTNFDAGLPLGQLGNVNSQMEDPQGNHYILFHPANSDKMYWVAAWRFKLVE